MQDKYYLIRCIDLAKLGGSDARPNPQVGAVIVYKDRIIGEGYHKKYGGPHAEVNAINSVAEIDKQLLPKSTIYVSLEPCCHYGNTPPCTDLIIENKIPKVRIAEIDPSQKVNRKGINRLVQNGIDLEVIPIPNQNTIAEFRTLQLKQRPYVQLKWAKSKDHYIGKQREQVWLSNKTSGVFTHKLRSYTDAILIGTNTALIDNPSLTLRNYPGKTPLRMVLDREGKIPKTHTLLSDTLPCIIFTENKRDLQSDTKQQVYIEFSTKDFINDLLDKMFEMKIHHLTVEGGAALHKSFVKAGKWDEAIVINTPNYIHDGIKAINLNGRLKSQYQLGKDEVLIIENIDS